MRAHEVRLPCEEHTICFRLETGNEEDPPVLVAYVLLKRLDKVLSRLWLAIKYIFGYGCRQGRFLEVELGKEEVTELLRMQKLYQYLDKNWEQDVKTVDIST